MAKNKPFECSISTKDKKINLDLSILRLQGGKGRKAYDFNKATLTINEDVKIYGSLIETKEGGYFFAVPSYRNKDGNYYSHCWIDGDTKALLDDLILSESDGIIDYLEK